MYETIKWPEEMKPSRSPIHFTNELDVAAYRPDRVERLARAAEDEVAKQVG